VAWDPPAAAWAQAALGQGASVRAVSEVAAVHLLVAPAAVHLPPPVTHPLVALPAHAPEPWG
jgi:hypothetical protein